VQQAGHCGKGIWAVVYIQFVQRALIKLLDGGHMTNLQLQLQNLLSVWNIRLTLFVHSSVSMYMHKAATTSLDAITRSFQNKYTLKWCPHTALPDGG